MIAIALYIIYKNNENQATLSILGNCKQVLHHEEAQWHSRIVKFMQKVKGNKYGFVEVKGNKSGLVKVKGNNLVFVEAWE